jgi:hypothetical protein
VNADAGMTVTVCRVKVAQCVVDVGSDVNVLHMNAGHDAVDHSMDLRCPNVTMIGRVVGDNTDGGAEYCSTDSSRPSGEMTSRAVDENDGDGV